MTEDEQREAFRPVTLALLGQGERHRGPYEHWPRPGELICAGQDGNSPTRIALPDNEGDDVPKFMDFHDDLKLPDEAIQQIAQDTNDAKADEFGVRQIELFHNPEGKVYCLLDAPDADAVRRHHQALGVPCGDVHEVSGLL